VFYNNYLLIPNDFVMVSLSFLPLFTSCKDKSIKKFLPSASFQPVGFVTFQTRAGAEAAKQDLQVRIKYLEKHSFLTTTTMSAKPKRKWNFLTGNNTSWPFHLYQIIKKIPFIF